MLFELSNVALVLIIFGIVLGTTGLGVLIGRRSQHLSDRLAEPLGVLQGALLGVVGLVLAFGLSLALSRYEDRRATLVAETNAIGTTWLRAQTLPEPIRTESLDLLLQYTESAILVSQFPPGSEVEEEASTLEQEIQRDLWGLLGEALADQPQGTAVRMYEETLNEMIDAQTVRIAALKNQVPNAVLVLEIIGAAIALGLLAAYLALIGRGTRAVFAASFLVAMLLLVTFDLDRPTRGFIEVPDDVIVNQYESMLLEPAASAPRPE